MKLLIEKDSIFINDKISLKEFLNKFKENLLTVSYFVGLALVTLVTNESLHYLLVPPNSQPIGFFGIITGIFYGIFLVITILFNSMNFVILSVTQINYFYRQYLLIFSPFYFYLMISEIMVILIFITYAKSAHSAFEITPNRIILKKKFSFKINIQINDGDYFVFSKVYKTPKFRTKEKITGFWIISKRNTYYYDNRKLFSLYSIPDDEIQFIIDSIREVLCITVDIEKDQIIFNEKPLKYNLIQKDQQNTILNFELKYSLIKRFIDYYVLICSAIMVLTFIKISMVDPSTSDYIGGLYNFLDPFNLKIFIGISILLFFYMCYIILNHKLAKTYFLLDPNKNLFSIYKQNLFTSKTYLQVHLDQLKHLNIIKTGSFDALCLEIICKSKTYFLDCPITILEAQFVSSSINKELEELNGIFSP